MKKKIFIIAGEKSGDLLGSKVLKNLDRAEFNVYGIGGEMMQQEGLQSIFPIEELSLMGIFEILPKLFSLMKRIKQTVKTIIELQPEVVLTIDSPEFCFRVMREVKKIDTQNKIKKIHFIAPSVWVYRKNRAEKIAKIYDLLLCILPFEMKYFEKYGLKSVFVGHPIFYSDSTEYLFNSEEVKYNSNSKNISITLGSRNSEVKRFLPLMKNVVNKINIATNFTLNFCILATENTFSYVEKNFTKACNIYFIKDKDKKINAIKNSLMAIAKSGTNTLEFSAFSIPIIVYYKFNFLTNFIAKFIQKRNPVRFVNLLNIIAAEEIIPECILKKCNEKTIYAEFIKLFNSKDLRMEQIKKTKFSLEQMGYGNVEFSSKLIINEIMKII